MAETHPAPKQSRWIDAQPGEWSAFAWSFLYFFALLTGYYVIRPVRDAMGAVHRLELLFTATFVCMLLLTPVYGALVARFPRRVFLPVVYGFFIACLVGFYYAFDSDAPWRGPVFFVWVAVFNLFAVSVFWSYMADVFQNIQAKRLYGGIAAGGTIGGFLGPIITARFVEQVGVANLLLVSAALLGVCLLCIVALAPHARETERRRGEAGGERAMGGTILAGLRLIRDTPLLQAMC
ncbi:MAG TPA: MFS transporter, partial [Candidatus Saccharimonadia bacterium]|nr:MFS transporter [Candidatus Saccharimonadia bacterium]